MTYKPRLLLALLPLLVLSCRYNASRRGDRAKAPLLMPDAGRALAEKPLKVPTQAVAPTVVARPPFAQLKQLKQVSLSDIAERAVRSVVNISSTRIVQQRRTPYHSDPYFYSRRPQPRTRRAQSLGSGVIVSADGVVLTNNHVVAKAKQIKVKLNDGRVLEAVLVGSDPKSDLAVLRLKGELTNLHPMPIGRSRRLRLGQVVLAIGNPFGLGQTVTMGIVSAVGRANMGIVDYEDFIQTDAAINPGNSGGALVNMNGQLVGINTAIFSKSGGYQGIGFAIPTDMAQPIIKGLLQHGRVVRGWLGVGIQTLTREMAEKLGIPFTRGVLVAHVEPGSPADRAGIRREDLLTSINGDATDTVVRLRNRVASTAPGGTIKLSLLRKGKRMLVPVVLGELGGKTVAKLDKSQGALGGLSVETLTDPVRRRLGIPRRASGVVVTSVDWGSAARSAGLQVNDVILEYDRKPIISAAQFQTLYLRAKQGKVILLIYRQGSTMYLLLER